MGYTSPSFLPIAASPAPSVARSGCSADATAERCCGPMGDGMTRPGSGPRSGRTEARSVVSAALRFHGFVLHPRSCLRPLFPKSRRRTPKGASARELWWSRSVGRRPPRIPGRAIGVGTRTVRSRSGAGRVRGGGTDGARPCRREDEQGRAGGGTADAGGRRPPSSLIKLSIRDFR